MLGLGLPERTGRLDLRDDLAGPQSGGVDVRDRLARDPLLLGVEVVDRRAVAGADVVALAIPRRRVVDLEEELEDVAVGDLLRVEDDLDRLGMRAVVAVGRVGDVAAGVSDARRDDAGALAQQVLHSPEAAARQDRLFGRLGHRWLLPSAERSVEAGPRMIVLPVIRSVGLRAATASSRVATVPMLGRRRPSRTRWTISLSWVRSASTTKSIARPSLGRASGGATTVTRVPPARIRLADRFWISPPMTSNTRSTPPTSSRVSFSRSTNSCAPKSSAFWRSAARPVPMT